MPPPADLVLANARVRTLDWRQPRAEAVAMRAGRILAVGAWADLQPLVGPATEVVDAEGGVAVPAFHDAHLHLLAYARTHSRLDCRAVRDLGDLRRLLAGWARALPAGAWVRAWGYDESRLREGRQPDRHDLDAAVPDRPVRLQHRNLHLDVLNTPALAALGLFDASSAAVERDSTSSEPTGRLYHAAELLHGQLPPPSEDTLAADVRRANDRLLAWGVTSVQDATHTNGPAEWALFQRLAARDALRVRLFFMPGARHWQDVWDSLHVANEPNGHIACGLGVPTSSDPQATLPRVLPGLVKLMLDEATSDPAEVDATVAAVHAAGGAVAIHAVSEAEVAIALEVLRDARRPRARRCMGARLPDRIEHGAVIPDAWLESLRQARLTVVGQPALVYERGDAYRAAYPPELHDWLHRAASLLRAGVRYAASSDAPVMEPAPGPGLYAAWHRRTRGGASLGVSERLPPVLALRAFTFWPAQAVGAAHFLGRLRPGYLADVAVLDPAMLDPTALGAASVEAALRPVRLTIMEGRVVWRRGA